MPLLKAYLWTDGRGMVALYPASPAAKQSRVQPRREESLSGIGHTLSGRGQ